MKTKKEYVSPEIEIIEFEVEDVITNSGVNSMAAGAGDNGIAPPDFWYGHGS
ncbi:MAG TPA: hypothetical protein PLD48_04600 [Bacillota bacterium]|nr:hypothetical protein [Bacillota bacterium]HOK67905.1 hypothetical protein [Bacillota bacterium]HPP84296.1 hypothetical protein [Bacillota bacterium]